MDFKLRIRNKMFIASLWSFVAILFIIFALYPLYSKINGLSKHINDAQIQIAIYEQERKNSEVTRSEYNSIKNDVDTFSGLFVSKNQLITFVSTLETLAAAHAITQDINLIDKADESQQKIPFTIRLNGDYASLVSYLGGLASLDQYIIINSIKFSGGGASMAAAVNAEIYPLLSK